MTTTPVTAAMARFAAALEFAQLSPEAVHAAKRFLLDTLACALGGYHQPDARICLDVLQETAGAGPATLIGSGRQVDPVSAALANAVMVRVLDYNDIYWQQDPCHPSDLISAALACCERRQTDGKELVVGIVLAYEFAMRLAEVAFPGLRERGWHHATLTAFAAPIVAGRCLRLDAARIQHAIGISGCHMGTPTAVTAGELSMMKNTVDPLATQSGVLAALLAERGYTGPAHVIDGQEGLVHGLGPQWRLERLTQELGEHWRILRCGMKAFPTEALTHGPISAVLELVQRHDLAPDRIERVELRVLPRAADILADPAKYDPRTKETADHSLPYCVAVAIVDRRVTPAQFEPARITDPALRPQLKKIEVIAEPAFDRLFPRLQRCAVAIATADGRRYERALDFPKGDFRNPLTDAELEQKFNALAERALSAPARRRLADAVWKLERLGTVSELMVLCRADR